MNDELRDHIREVVAETLGLDPAEVGPDASARTLAAWSSLAHLRVLSSLEQAFGVRFTMQEMTAMSSISSIEAVLAAKGIEV